MQPVQENVQDGEHGTRVSLRYKTEVRQFICILLTKYRIARTSVLYRSETPRAMLAIVNISPALAASMREQATFLPASQRDEAITWLLNDP